MTQSSPASAMPSTEEQLADYVYSIQNYTDAKEVAAHLWPVISAAQSSAGSEGLELVIQRALLDDEYFGNRAADQDQLEEQARGSAVLIAEAVRSVAQRVRVPQTEEEIESLLLQGFRQWGFNERQISVLTYAELKDDGTDVTRVRTAMKRCAAHFLARGASTLSSTDREPPDYGYCLCGRHRDDQCDYCVSLSSPERNTP